MTTKFIHIREKQVTIAYDITGYGLVNYAVAKANPKDVYSKAKGRAVAAGRLNSDHFKRTIALGEGEKAINTVLTHLEANWPFAYV